MRSDLMKSGIDRIAHRALFRALGLTQEELDRPIIGVVSAVAVSSLPAARGAK